MQQASERTQRWSATLITAWTRPCDFGIGPEWMQKTLFQEKLQWSKLHVRQQSDQPSSDTPLPSDPVNYSSTLANERVEDQALIKAIK